MVKKIVILSCSLFIVVAAFQISSMTNSNGEAASNQQIRRKPQYSISLMLALQNIDLLDSEQKEALRKLSLRLLEEDADNNQG